MLVEDKLIYKNIISSIIFLNQNVLSIISPLGLYPVFAGGYGIQLSVIRKILAVCLMERIGERIDNEIPKQYIGKVAAL